MHKVNGYTLTSNSHSSRQDSSLMIKRDGIIYARMRFKEPICDPLRQIQTNPSNPYRGQLVEMLISNGVPSEDIMALLKPSPSKYYVAKMAKEKKGD